MKQEFSVNGFDSIEDYVLSHNCPHCGAAAWTACTWDIDGFHLARVDLGIAHRRKDIGSAPWPEDRVPGERYSSIVRPGVPS